MNQTEVTLLDKISPLVEGIGYQIAYLLLRNSPKGGSLLQLFIEKSSGDPITIEDCTFVTKRMLILLEAQSIINEKYTLEVSSPGIDRPLFALQDYQQHIKENIKLTLKNNLNGQKKFIGNLVEVNSNNCIIIKTEDNNTIELEIANILHCNLVPEIIFKKINRST